MSFEKFVSSFAREISRSPGFESSSVSMQQQIHHLAFVANLVNDSATAHHLAIILEEQRNVKVCIMYEVARNHKIKNILLTFY